jgi:hypothetical protein
MIVGEEKFLDTIDVNFDGYVDLEIFSHDGGVGPNYGNNYYIFRFIRLKRTSSHEGRGFLI